MLRISRPDPRDPQRLKLEGRLVTRWVDELRAATPSGEVWSLDLTAVSFVDDEGLALLASLAAAGHGLECSPYLRALLAAEVP